MIRYKYRCWFNKKYMKNKIGLIDEIDKLIWEWIRGYGNKRILVIDGVL